MPSLLQLSMARPEMFPSAWYWGQFSLITSSMILRKEGIKYILSQLEGDGAQPAMVCPALQIYGKNLWDQGDVQISWPGKRSQPDSIQGAFGKYS